MTKQEEVSIRSVLAKLANQSSPVASLKGVDNPMVDPNNLDEASQAIKDIFVEEMMKLLPTQPFQVNKTPKPILRNVEESFGFGDIGGTISTTEDTGHTYTEQDLENAAFETAQPYIESIKAALIKKYGKS